MEDSEIKRLVIEIISLVLFLIIVVPICVDASNRYQEKRDVLLKGVNTSVDISNLGDVKKITVYSNHDDAMRVNLFLKISKFTGDYLVYLDDQVYDIRSLDCSEDEDYQYYNLGIYEVDQLREFHFQLKSKNKAYYDETITYSFVTEGLL